ncbi:hypothetical protein [Paraburkholderia kirstenboschensis]|uniref:hypothetical protein n=1 Tax=Paraburkholderia kirstenboschensis TaxID=1245436 RepID=UPI000FFB5B45|nr:hypothetical protein [Paraburkholderia kirstenboschensis]
MVFGQAPSSPTEDECQSETLQKKDPQPGIYLRGVVGTMFTDAEAIRYFLKLAREYQANHATN